MVYPEQHGYVVMGISVILLAGQPFFVDGVVSLLP